MSEMINNREFRQKVLKELITELHNGKSLDEVKPRFEKLIEGISTKEIAEMEQALVMEGMPIEQIQNLCDVHAAVFKGSIEEIHRPQDPKDIPGHPLHTFQLENRAIERLLDERVIVQLENFKATDNPQGRETFLQEITQLWEIDKHYSRKENLLFPYMERYGITAPPKVMWGVDDEIRGLIKDLMKKLKDEAASKDEIIKLAEEMNTRIGEMIFKEESILFPMVTETLAEDEWIKIKESSEEIGYTLITPRGDWKPVRVNVEEKTQNENIGYDGHDSIKSSNGLVVNGAIQFDAGMMTVEETNAMLNTLPLDITFVDKDGIVKYFTQGKERIFPRPLTVIGREVKNCHPPSSVHIVERIVEELQSGVKDHEDFWINMNGKFVYIRYYAVRSAEGEFLGVMELTQDIKPIQEISGERRLMSES